MSVLVDVIAPGHKHEPPLSFHIRQTMVKDSNWGGGGGGRRTSPYVLTSRAASREATRETARLRLLCSLILACWVLTA